MVEFPSYWYLYASEVLLLRRVEQHTNGLSAFVSPLSYFIDVSAYVTFFGVVGFLISRRKNEVDRDHTVRHYTCGFRMLTCVKGKTVIHTRFYDHQSLRIFCRQWPLASKVYT